MIEDLEMRDLFRIESEEHLQQLEDGLLRLEKDPDNTAILEELFREAHSLKGSSRMLGQLDIEKVAHRFEDILGRASKGTLPLLPETIDTMYRCLDSIRKLVEEALTGRDSGVVLADVLSSLQQVMDAPPSIGQQEQQQPEALPAVSHEGIPSGASAESPLLQAIPVETSPSATASPGHTGHEPFSIETIRVETRKLDLLMTQAGELTVAKLRIAQRCADMEALLEKWEYMAGLIRSDCANNSEPSAHSREFSKTLEQLKSAVYDDNSRLATVAGEIEAGVQAIRLLPLSTIFNLFNRMVRDLARERSREVQLIIEGGETAADKRILEEMKDPLMHIIRNAIDHGIESPQEREKAGKPKIGTISLRAYQTAGNIVIEVRDDGRGLDSDAILRSARKSRQWREEELAAMLPEQIWPLIFESGLSTTAFVSDVSGRGVGLDVVRSNVERLKGSIAVASTAGGGCSIRINLPITLATVRVLIIVAKGIAYALPVEYVLKSYPLPRSGMFTIEGRAAVLFEEKTVAVARLSDLLRFHRTDFVVQPEDPAINDMQHADDKLPCIIINAGGGRIGLLVDELLDEQEIVLKPQSVLLKHIQGISGATILGNGEVCMVLNPPEIIINLRQQELATTSSATADEEEVKKRILIAEDSLTTRTQMKRILEGGGYEVVTAVDGLEALNLLGSHNFDALVSDISMPNMDGLTLTHKVRQNKKQLELPVILVTMLASDEDKRRGMEAGANAYITKPAFDQKLLLDTLRRLT